MMIGRKRRSTANTARIVFHAGNDMYLLINIKTTPKLNIQRTSTL